MFKRRDQRLAQYRKIRDCLEGEDQVKDQGQLYLKKPDAMTTANYEAYKERAQFYGAAESTLRALVGLALRKDPVIKLPARLEPLRLSATNDRAPLSVMIEQMVREVMSMGRFGLMLDFPQSNTTVLTPPHFVTWTAESIEDYKVAYNDGQLELTQVILASDEALDGDQIFLELCLEDGIYRIRRFIEKGVNESRLDVGEEIIPIIKGRPLTFIPFIFVSDKNLTPNDEKPPLLDLCNLNLGHYRNSADREHAMFLTATPTPWIAGNLSADKVPTCIGSGTVWNLPEGTQVGMLEFQGPSMTAFRELMGEKLDQMASLGARMLSASMNRNETTSTATQRSRSELSLLQSVVVMTEAALTRLLRLAADWMGENPDDVSVTFSRDFIEVTMDPAGMVAQMKLWQSGAISRQTLYENLQQGEVARADRSYQDEKDLIDEEGGDMSPLVALLPDPAQ
jgi:hypothetical protein